MENKKNHYSKKINGVNPIFAHAYKVILLRRG